MEMLTHLDHKIDGFERLEMARGNPLNRVKRNFWNSGSGRERKLASVYIE
jgi:hypothetical protein